MYIFFDGSNDHEVIEAEQKSKSLEFEMEDIDACKFNTWQRFLFSFHVICGLLWKSSFEELDAKNTPAENAKVIAHYYPP